MIKNWIRFFESSYGILNVKIDKQIEKIENMNANVNVGDRIRSILLINYMQFYKYQKLFRLLSQIIWLLRMQSR